MGDGAMSSKAGWWLTWMCRLVLGGCFVWASWHKIAAPGEFAKILYGYDLFPGILINVLAVWVPFLELTAGICLITGGYRLLSKRSALLVINALLFCFILIIGYNLARGHSFDCGCFSFEQAPEGGARAAAVRLLIRDAFLLLAGGFLWWRFRREIPGQLSGHPDHPKA